MSLKDSIINNIGRLIAGGIITLVTMLFTWSITPVKEIVAVPRALIQMQTDFEERQSYLIAALDKQRQADSVIFIKISELQTANQSNYTQLGIIKSKVTVIGSEFPDLYRRFEDIEKAVANTNTSIVWNIPSSNMTN